MDLYSEVTGHGGETLVCLAGLASDHTDWMQQVPQWSQHFRVVTMDNRDSGRSPKAASPYGLADMATDTLQSLDSLGVERFHLVGASMGGAIGQHIALLAPGRVTTLTLAVSWVRSGPWEKERCALLAQECHLLGREAFESLLMSYSLTQEFYEDADAVAFVRAVLAANEFPQPHEAFSRQVGACADHDLTGQLRGLPMPVHVVSAERDLLLPPWKQTELHAEIPGSVLTTLPGMAHGVHMEAPDLFTSTVLDFIATHDPRPTTLPMERTS